jgi:hypothetical protein
MLVGMFLSLVIFFTDKEPVTFNLTDQGIYTLGMLSLYKVGDHYLFVNLGDGPSLRIVKAEGTELFRYDKAGRGPGELNLHSVFGITESKIYVHSRGVGILIFDHQLQLLSQDEYKFEQNYARVTPVGVALEGNRFLVQGNPFLSHYFSLFDLKDLRKQKPWTAKSRIIVKDYPEEPRRGRGYIHHNYLFAYSGSVPLDDPDYRVHVYTQSKNQWPQVAELSYTAEDLKPPFPEVLALIVAGYKISDYYIVDLMSGLEGKSGKPKPNRFYVSLDIFDSNGKFLKRVAKPEQFVVPVMNAEEIFLYEERDDDFLVAFDIEAYLKR